MGSFWAILTPFWPKMALFGLFWAILAHMAKMTPFWVTSSVGTGPKWPKMAILGHFGPFWAILGQNDPILGYFPCRTGQKGHFGPFWAILGHFGPFGRVLQRK